MFFNYKDNEDVSFMEFLGRVISSTNYLQKFNIRGILEIFPHLGLMTLLLKYNIKCCSNIQYNYYYVGTNLFILM